MRVKLSLAVIILCNLQGAFDATQHYHTSDFPAMPREDICSTSVFNANITTQNNYATYTLKSGDEYDLLPSDILYAPAFLYNIDGHCQNNQAARAWFDSANKLKMSIIQRREVLDQKADYKTYGLAMTINDEIKDIVYIPKIKVGSHDVWQLYEWQKYFDPKIKTKFGIDVFKSVYIKNDQTSIPLKLSVSDGLATDKQIKLPSVTAKKLGGIDLSSSGSEFLISNQTANRTSVDTFDENIHKIIIPKNTTGVIDTYFTALDDTKAATYFITQDINIDETFLKSVIANPNNNNKKYLRLKNGGRDYFEPVVDTRYDVSTLGLLYPGYFEGAIYKNNNGAYVGDVYTMHGDFLNRFVTGFGPDGGWSYDFDNNPNYYYDGGWMSHRYLVDNSSYNKDKTADDFGLSYDKYDPITTYIDKINEQMHYASITKDTKTIYKQYAVDNYDDIQNGSLSLHVRPLYAYAKKDASGYVVSDELMNEYGNSGVKYDIKARYYPDPQKIVSLRPISLELSRNELAYHSDIKLQNDLMDFEGRDTVAGTDKPMKSNKHRKFTINRKDGSTKEVFCGWIDHYEDTQVAPPRLFCYDMDGGWREEDSAYGKIKNPDSLHTIQVSYDELNDGVDIFKLALNDNSSIPARRVPENHGLVDNGHYTPLELTASLETVYFGNEIRNGTTWDSSYQRSYTYNHKDGDSDYFIGYQYGSRDDVLNRNVNIFQYNDPSGKLIYRYDVGIKGTKTQKDNENINLVKSINFDLRLLAKKDEDGKMSYIGNVKFTDEGKAAIAKLTKEFGSGQDIIFLIKIHNIKDPNTGRVIPFSEPFKIKVSGEPRYELSSAIASDKGNNTPAKDAKGNYVVYTQVGGLFERPGNYGDFNSSGDGGHFVLDINSIGGTDVPAFIKITLQRQKPSGEWEDMGDVISRANCIYRGSGYCTHSGHIHTLDNRDDHALIYSGLLPRYNLFHDSYDTVYVGKQFFHFTLQEVDHNVDYGKDFGLTHTPYFANKEDFENKIQSGVFRFKIHSLSKEQVKQAVEDYKQEMGYKDLWYAQKDKVYKYCTSLCGYPTHRNINQVEFEAYVREKYKLLSPYTYSNTFVVRPAFVRLKSIGNVDMNDISKSHKTTYTYKNPLKANDKTPYGLTFDFYSGYTHDGGVDIANYTQPIKGSLLSNVNVKLDKLAFLFRQFNSKGEERPYMLYQNLTNSTIVSSEINKVDTSTLTSAVTFPYVGKKVGILALVSFKHENHNSIACRDKNDTDEENIAINGQYGCYPEPILATAEFAPDAKNILCEAKNQYAFFRTREDTEDDEKLLKFDTSSLYNILYQCTQKYADEEGNPLYSVDEKDCTGDGCLFTVGQDKFKYEITGSLTNDNAKDKGLHIYLKDINDKDSTKHTYQNLYDLTTDYTTDKNIIVDKFYENIYNNLNPTLRHGKRIYWLDSVWVFFNPNGRREYDDERHYEAYINDNANNANDDVMEVGNTFMVSVSKDRKDVLSPIYFKELISDDEKDTSGKANKVGVLKLGSLAVEDVILKQGLGANYFVSMNELNSNNAKLPITVYNGNKFINISTDNDFTGSKLSVSKQELNEKVIENYTIEETDIVDAMFENGSDIGYMLKGKDQRAKLPFIDVGYIKSNSKNNITRILQPSSNTVKFIYDNSLDGDWRGVRVKVK